jgi:hypothetical protein
MIAKEMELARNHRGTLHRSGRKERDRAKWAHERYPGWIKLARGLGDIVEIEVHSRAEDTEWQLLQSMLGFLDRHFAEQIHAVNIQY